MSDEIPIGPNRCTACGGEYGEHEQGCRSLVAPFDSASESSAEFGIAMSGKVCILLVAARFEGCFYLPATHIDDLLAWISERAVVDVDVTPIELAQNSESDSGITLQSHEMHYDDGVSQRPHDAD